MEDLHPDLHNPDKAFVWEAPDFEVITREAKWYVWSIIIASALVLLALFVQKNLLFALFVIIAEAMLLFLSWQQPRKRTYGISPRGIYAEQELIAEHKDISGFAIVDLGGEHLELVFRFKARHRHYIKYLLPRPIESTVRDLLATVLPEFTYIPQLGEALAKRFGL